MAIPLSALPLGTQLSFTYGTPTLAKDPSIGLLIEPEEGSVEALSSQAISMAYSKEWIERFVSEDLRFAFTRTYDQVLAKLLPQSSISVGKAIRGNDMIEVPLRFGPDMKYGSFVWIEVSEGVYTLVSITLAE